MSTSSNVSDLDVESCNSEEQLHTIVMRNIPNKYTRALFLELLDKRGFHGTYRMVYLPVDYGTQLSVGYAFVHFADSSDALRCKTEFQGFKSWHFAGSPKVCSVDWSTGDDSLEAHIERLRNCSVMHSSIPEEFRPALFDSTGDQLHFPEPTKSVKKPRAAAGAGHRVRRTKGHNAAC
jgi:RNA recognition motif-containing protein